MQFTVEKHDPQRDLGGLCDCFLSSSWGKREVASPHIQRHFELLYCMEGSYELMVERQSFLLTPGDVALIHPMEPHQTRSCSEGNNNYLVLKFMPEALYSATHPIYEMKYIFPYLHFSFQRSYVYTKEELAGSGLEELLMRILHERNREEYGYEMAVRADISLVLLWFIRAWHKRSETQTMDEKALTRLQKALAYVEEHLTEALNIQAVADHLEMGLSTFSRFFARAAGSTFPAYVRSLRLSRAVAMLVDSDRSITEIALECGFSTASYLILCFRQQYKMTPAQFRGMYTANQGVNRKG